jgi:hypothetical protein
MELEAALLKALRRASCVETPSEKEWDRKLSLHRAKSLGGGHVPRESGKGMGIGRPCGVIRIDTLKCIRRRNGIGSDGS